MMRVIRAEVMGMCFGVRDAPGDDRPATAHTSSRRVDHDRLHLLAPPCSWRFSTSNCSRRLERWSAGMALFRPQGVPAPV